MKKQVNKNFVLSLTLIAVSVVVSLMGLELLDFFNPGEKEFLFYILTGLGFVVWGVVIIFMLIIPVISVGLIFIFSLIARIVYKDTPKRILAYRILMGFSFIGQISMFFVSWMLMLCGGWGSVVGLLISAYIFWAIFQGIRGTYTQRVTSNKENNREDINNGTNDNK